MMELWATKDHYERETDEADRLVRPVPKVKPPRWDKRREDMQPDRDPDVEGDPDVAKDPDLSMNYKTIGGSASAHKVLAAFLRRADEDLIKVRHRDTGRVVQIKPETLKAKPGEYEEVSDEEEGKEPGEAQPKDEGKGPGEAQPKEDAAKNAVYEAAGQELYDAAKTDPALRELLRTLSDPKNKGEKADVAGLAMRSPTSPVGPFLQGKKIPKGIETLGDLQKAAIRPPKPSKKPGSPKEPGVPSKEAPPKPEAPKEAPPKADEVKEKPKGEEPAKEKPKGEEPAKEKPKGEEPAKGEEPKGPAKEKPKSREEVAKGVVDKFLEESKNQPELEKDWGSYVDSLPTTTRDADGKPVWFDPKSGDELPWEKLPMEQRAQLVQTFEKKHKADSMAALTARSLESNKAARKAVESMFDPESELSEKLASLRHDGYDLNTLPIKKNLPELAGVVPESIKTVGELQRLVQSHADLFMKKKPYQVWEKEKGPESEEFSKYAQREGATIGDDGQPQFRLGRKNVPWAKLPPEKKAELHDDFTKTQAAEKWSEDLTEAARRDPDVAHALYLLGNPASPAAAKLATATNLDDPLIDEYLPSLRNLTFPPGMSLKDVVETAKRSFKPVPPPKRREASQEEVTAAELMLKRGFQKYPLFGARIAELRLHPDDVQQVFGTYERARAATLKPEQVQDWVKDLQSKGLYTTDPRAVTPPKAGLDKNGARKSWKDLTPEEQSNAYATHRNEVIATSMAARDMLNEAFQDMGMAPNVADTLALAKLSRKPGESRVDRALRARPLADHLFDRALESGAKPHEYSPEDVQQTLDAVGDDPMARHFAVAQFQANDYQQARERFLNPDSPTHIDERDPPRNIAARLREASEFLRKSDRRYPAEYRVGNMAEMFRRRVMMRLMALDPEKAAEINPEIQKLDADDWDVQKETRDSAMKKWKKENAAYLRSQEKAEREFKTERGKTKEKDPYRGTPIKSVRERLAEMGISAPVPPPPLPPKPVGYDLVRKSPKQQAQSGQSLWRRLFKGLTASERVAARFLQYSSCAPGDAMGSNPTDRRASSDRTGVYWGVDPTTQEKVVNLPHVPWQQAHARDLTGKDYDSILAAAREWMKVPVLARVLDEKDSLGAVRDIQLRAALDLAIRDTDGGKYSVGLHPTVYNNLLAQLGGGSQKETLLTIRQASGSLYTQATGEDRSMNAATEIRKFAAEIAAQHPGLAFDLTNLAFRVAQQEQEEQGGQAQQQGQQQAQQQGQQQKDASKYTALRGAVIRLAHTNPAVRPALVPVLRMLKQG